MAYVVKYVGNCGDKNLDISSLYARDIENGNRVILVCENDKSLGFSSCNARKINSPIDATSCTDALMLLTTLDNARNLAIDCAYTLYAGECQVFMKYDGIYTADPALTTLATRLDKIDYDEVSELCTSGYTGVDPDMVEYAKKQGVALRMLSYNQPYGQGTVIKEVMAFGSAAIKGIIKEPDICIVSLRDIPDKAGVSYFIFQAVSDAGINVDMISLPASDYGSQDISFTIRKEDKYKVLKVLEEKQEEIGYANVSLRDNVAKISVVGAGVKTGVGIAASVFKIFYENDISLRLISTSEIKITVFVDKKSADLAVEKIHQAFIN